MNPHSCPHANLEVKVPGESVASDEEHTAILHCDGYKDPDPPALSVHLILDKSFLLQHLFYWMLHHWKSLSWAEQSINFETME